MDDKNGVKRQLIDELTELLQRIDELETSEKKCKYGKHRLNNIQHRLRGETLS